MTRDREAIARIIDPEAAIKAQQAIDDGVEPHYSIRARISMANDKADEILALPAPVGEWQPIESAPKAVRVLAFVDDAVVVARWSARWEHYVNLLAKSDESPICKPTHWMPLPPAPGGGQ